MPSIRSISDLRNKSHEISRLCHRTGEPVFITRHGVEDLVILSAAAWEREKARTELYALLDEAEQDRRAGDTGTSPAVLRRRLRG
jgi:prevent-host-death family protein